MTEDKHAEERERRHTKRRYGPRISGKRSVELAEQEIAKRAKRIERERHERHDDTDDSR